MKPPHAPHGHADGDGHVHPPARAPGHPHDHPHDPPHGPNDSHGHSHGHAQAVHGHLGHAHLPARHDSAFALGIALNLGFVAVEAFYGWRVGSLALLADAGHNLSDVAGLVLAWAAAWAARRPADARHTYGWQRAGLLAALANALLLLVAMGSLGWEALQRLGTPQATQGTVVMAVAGAGILVNGATALLFLRGSADDLNLRGAFLHMAADAAVSLGVVLGGALMLWQAWTWVDPVLSLLIAALIVAGTWGLLRQSVHLLFDGVPDGIDLTQVRSRLLGVPGVGDLHDLHVWAMGTRENALTAHLVLDGSVEGAQVLQAAGLALQQAFGLQHITLQLESPAYAAQCGVRHGDSAGG